MPAGYRASPVRYAGVNSSDVLVAPAGALDPESGPDRRDAAPLLRHQTTPRLFQCESVGVTNELCMAGAILKRAIVF